ncbi:globin domain-containing protein [Kitasatospora sp. NPDC094011]|uniref:globin domain-containing protein n=1 Tax=Kitasatospora sp. NPDC094011 TaxID=3364090 RepID=UPI00381D5F75
MTLDPVLVKRSFAAVAPHGPVVAEYFYRHLFEHDPALRGLFAEHLDEQQDRLFAALGALVTHLEDTDTALGLLRDLGTRHAAHGALVEHFPAVGASLLATLAHYAGDEWTPETEAAWTAVYAVVSDTMGAALTEARSA